MNEKIKIISRNAIVAALYVVITLLSFPISFQAIQFRLAEILVLLCFFRKDYIFGICIGCAISNLFSSIGLIDVAFGTFATLLACLCICFCKHLIVAILFPIILNGLIIGLELFFFVQADFLTSLLWVALGELTVMIFGYITIQALKKREKFHHLINSKQNKEFSI